MKSNIEQRFENALGHFDKSAEKVKQVAESTKEIEFDPAKLDAILAIVDKRINSVATNIRKEMAEERKLIIKDQKKSLLINIGITSMAVVAFIFNRLLGWLMKLIAIFIFIMFLYGVISLAFKVRDSVK